MTKRSCKVDVTDVLSGVNSAVRECIGYDPGSHNPPFPFKQKVSEVTSYNPPHDPEGFTAVDGSEIW